MKLPDCMMPDGADPCIGYRELKADNERLRDTLWAIGRYAEAEFREGEKGYQAAILAAQALAGPPNNPLPERCDKCGWGHNVGNPCPPIEAHP